MQQQHQQIPFQHMRQPVFNGSGQMYAHPMQVPQMQSPQLTQLYMQNLLMQRHPVATPPGISVGFPGFHPGSPMSMPHIPGQQTMQNDSWQSTYLLEIQRLQAEHMFVQRLKENMHPTYTTPPSQQTQNQLSILQMQQIQLMHQAQMPQELATANANAMQNIQQRRTQLLQQMQMQQLLQVQQMQQIQKVSAAALSSSGPLPVGLGPPPVNLMSMLTPQTFEPAHSNSNLSVPGSTTQE
eukprot:gnl/MRDRNA2_/MRDRNA2_84288_c0_seq5.p1 gnl/MRDRNA2_/MRDRNA2_84288_c0~~gnl/MRDRNA2_/MRDRNA2_84288_c0_seq5.p1  ORF type:complete len:239 (+),score=51.67 gnl/MRDRNA2_/MRDRNA2_84288_c0_seq5:920-1636(+)